MSQTESPPTGPEFNLGFTQAVQRAEASVVRVQGHGRTPASGIVWSDDGLMVTSLAAVGDGDEMRVQAKAEAVRTAEVVGREPALDLALLRVAEAGAAPPRPAFADAGELQVGQWTVALGRPGQAIRASARIVGVLAPELRTPLGGKLDRYVESDRGFPRGFAGGPLCDVHGRVIGMNTSALLRGADLTVPVISLARAVSELLAHGRVRRGYLGVNVHPVQVPQALRAQARHGYALLVLGVAEDSPAARGGVLLGDALLELDGQTVSDPRELSAVLRDAIGRELEALVLRGGQLLTLRLTPGERP